MAPAGHRCRGACRFHVGVARMIELIEVEPGRWRVARETRPVARSNLPCPYVISDTMPPTEQVDGKFYESKAAFRAVGRALGLTEVGNEKLKPKRARQLTRNKGSAAAVARRAIAQYKDGERPCRATVPSKAEAASFMAAAAHDHEVRQEGRRSAVRSPKSSTAPTARAVLLSGRSRRYGQPDRSYGQNDRTRPLSGSPDRRSGSCQTSPPRPPPAPQPTQAEVPINENPVNAPAPVTNQPPEKPADMKDPDHRRESIRKAFERAKTRDPNDKGEPRKAKMGDNNPPEETKPEREKPEKIDLKKPPSDAAARSRPVRADERQEASGRRQPRARRNQAQPGRRTNSSRTSTSSSRKPRPTASRWRA